MGTRSLRASQKGIERAKTALAGYALSQNELAEELEMSRQTINNFFKGKPISRDNFRAICDRLGLDLENAVAIEAVAASNNQQLDASELDVLVQDVRQKVQANIHERCGTMCVLDMTRPIELDTLYTDVNILQDITGRQRLDLAELLKRCGLEDFDSLGFAHAKRERCSGLEVVEQFDKLMLLGKPGAGKTTFLKRLAMLCNQGTFQGHRVPVFITLKDFGDSSPKPILLTYIRRWLKELGVPEPQRVEQILNQGRAFLLLDGLDEVSESKTRQVLQELQAFAYRFPQNAFVVSCRIAAKEFTFQQFTEVEVADFSDEQIANFAARWFEAKQLADKAEAFLEKLTQYPRIKQLTTSPLLLTLLCLVFEGRTDFPANRSDLYEEGLDVLLKKWNHTRKSERENAYHMLTPRRKADLLSHLAFTTFEEGNYFFKQKKAEHSIESYIQTLPNAQPDAPWLDSEAVLKSIEAQHGLLVERAKKIYSFSHLTFHEYFTARRIEQCDSLHPVLVSHLTEKRWREVFLLAIEMIETKEKADSLLLSMKAHVDQLLADDNQLQQFLNWVQQKSRSVKVSYKAVALRAFYFALDRIFDAIYSHAFARAHTYATILNLDLDFALSLAIILDFDHDLALAIDQSLANDLIGAQSELFDPVLDFDGYITAIHQNNSGSGTLLDYHLAQDLNLSLDFSHDSNINPVLRQSLQHLRAELPDPEKDEDYFRQWWQTTGSTWAEQLRSVMVEYCNIGHNWQFDYAQEEKLQQYYDANKLLVDCLNSDCYVSREVRQEIEESLLLPMAEIEQRFPHQRQIRE